MVVGHFFQALSLCSDASEVGSGSLASSFELEALRSHLDWPKGRRDDFSQGWGGPLWLHCGILCPSLSSARWSALSSLPVKSPLCPSQGYQPPTDLLLHLVPVCPCSASSPYPSLTFSSFAPVPSTQVGCPPGKRNSLLSWLSGNTAWLEKFVLPPVA